MRIFRLSGDPPFPFPPYESDLPADERTASRRRRVLVVDDERLIADTVVQILNIHGYDAFAAYAGEEALALAKSFVPDFLLSDVMMPGMNGIELAAAVSELVPNLAVLLFSGQAGTGQLVQNSRMNFALEAKPIHPEKLLQVLASIGSKRR